MRTLAGRLGVRASSLYRHFPDRSSIERTLALQTAEKLLTQMRQAAEGQRGERAILAASRSYLDFATAEPSFYEMMMTSFSINPKNDLAKQIFRFFVQMVSESTNQSEDSAGAAALWSFLNGFTILIRSGQLDENSVRFAFTRGIQALVRGLSVANADAVGSPA